MSIASEILRLQNAKIDIKISIENKGVNVPNNETIDNYSTYINQIPTGGGNADLIDVLERDITSINIPSGTTKIGQYAFYQCAGLTSVNIPNTVTRIGENAFQQCTGLTSITIPDSVTTIEMGAFNSCSNLSNVTISNGVGGVGDSAFGSCNSLTSLVLPESIEGIGSLCFSYSSNLTSITFLGTTAPFFDRWALSNTSSNLVIYVPSESVNAYRTAIDRSNSQWSGNIQAIPTA